MRLNEHIFLSSLDLCIYLSGRRLPILLASKTVGLALSHRFIGGPNHSSSLNVEEGAVDRRLKSQVSKLLLIIDSTRGTPSSKLV